MTRIEPRHARILRRMLLVVVLTQSAGAGAVTPKTDRLDYRVARQTDGDVTRYTVTLRFKGDTSGRTMLHLPHRWASAQGAERGIDRLEVLTKGARIESTEQAEVRRIVHRPDEPLTVRYLLRQIAAGEPTATAPTQYLPVLRPRYFEWIGWTAWVIPGDNDRRVRVNVHFDGLPPDWSFATSFGLDPSNVSFVGPLQQFQSAIFVGGDFRLRARSAPGGPVITAIRGDWSFRDSELADRITTIVAAERTFWRDDRQRFFLVALLPTIASGGSQNYTGTSLTQSFVTFVTDRMTLPDLDALWAHEYFHTWNNQQLGRLPEPQPLLYWFSEGFTEYYTELVLLRLGAITLDQYAAVYDQKLDALARSPAQDRPNDEIARSFFTNSDVGALPYLRGRFLAAQWDARIRAASNGNRSLDDAMRLLRDQYLRGAAVLDEGRIVAAMKAVGLADPEADVARQIDRGESPRLKDGDLGHCIRIGETSEAQIDWGFDLSASTNGEGSIVGVRSDGPASAAGIRDSQFLRSARTIGKGVDRQVEVGVVDRVDAPPSEVRSLRYVPAVGVPLVRQTATLVEGLTEKQRAQCLEAFAVAPSMPVRSRSASLSQP